MYIKYLSANQFLFDLLVFNVTTSFKLEICKLYWPFLIYVWHEFFRASNFYWWIIELFVKCDVFRSISITWCELNIVKFRWSELELIADVIEIVEKEMIVLAVIRIRNEHVNTLWPGNVTVLLRLQVHKSIICQTKYAWSVLWLSNWALNIWQPYALVFNIFSWSMCVFLCVVIFDDWFYGSTNRS